MNIQGTPEPYPLHGPERSQTVRMKAQGYDASHLLFTDLPSLPSQGGKAVPFSILKNNAQILGSQPVPPALQECCTGIPKENTAYFLLLRSLERPPPPDAIKP